MPTAARHKSNEVVVLESDLKAAIHKRCLQPVSCGMRNPQAAMRAAHYSNHRLQFKKRVHAQTHPSFFTDIADDRSGLLHITTTTRHQFTTIMRRCRQAAGDFVRGTKIPVRPAPVLYCGNTARALRKCRSHLRFDLARSRAALIARAQIQLVQHAVE